MHGLWIDTTRKCPFVFSEWHTAQNYEEAIDFLNKNEYNQIWLDHDLSSEKTGHDLILWMIENNKMPTNQKIFIHSLDPDGTEKMCSAITKHYNTTPEKHQKTFLKIQKKLLGILQEQ